MRAEPLFCGLPMNALQAFDVIKYASAYPKGTKLFVEGQPARGIFIVCQGRTKLCITSDGLIRILKITEPGEVLGLSATLSGKPYELNAETMGPCQVNFFKRDDFLRFLKEYPAACFKAIEKLSEKYGAAWQEVRSFAYSHSGEARLAKLLVEWSSTNGEWGKPEPRIKLAISHKEIGQIIGSSRETVTRMFADLRKRQIALLKGATLVIRNKSALKQIANH
jgi:CRP/FNR family transcriptional regulator, cyclic AMP receptor protein